MRRIRHHLVPLVMLLGFAVAAPAENPDAGPIQTGYELLYQGNVEGAYEHFRRLYALQADNLAAAYGALSALYATDLREESAAKEFEQQAAELIERAEARYGRDEQDLEGLFYLAQTHGLRAAYKIQHDKGNWSAARDGAKAKKYSEEYVKRNPDRGDAYLALGLYNYYVDILPTFVKFLRVLLFLPGGDRGQGLKQIERAAREARLWAPQAQMELVQIYGWLEGRVEEALEMAQELQRKYPENPDLRFRLASLYASPMLEDYRRSEEHYALIVKRAREGHPHYKRSELYEALLGLGRARRGQWRLEEAIAALTPTIEEGVKEPEWVMPGFLLARGGYRSLLNQAGAGQDFERVLEEKKWKAWHGSARRALEQMEERQRTGDAAVYAELVPGNRLVAEKRWQEAEAFYESYRRKHPHDWQVRYRLAYLEFARGQYDKAESGLSEIVHSHPRQRPDWLKASALLFLARIRDLRGERQQALKLYEKVVDDYEKESAAGAARLGLLTPFRVVPPRPELPSGATR